MCQKNCKAYTTTTEECSMTINVLIVIASIILGIIAIVNGNYDLLPIAILGIVVVHLKTRDDWSPPDY